jgi:hypothetical protein
LTDADGRPVAVQVYPGNTADPKTVPDQVETLTKRFGLTRVVLVGDRGMLTQTQIECARKSLGKGEATAETFRWDLAGNQPRPAKLASSRKRVLRGVRATGAAKRRQRVSGPCH